MEGIEKSWDATRKAWELHAGEARKRGEIVKQLTAWLQGKAPPPDGATRADVMLRGAGWTGWEWTRRGREVSPAANRECMDRAAAALVTFSKERIALLDRAEKCKGSFALAGVIPQDTELPEERIVRDCVVPALEAVHGCMDALDEERMAWKEWESAYCEARATLPVEEIDAARARLAAEEASRTRADDGERAQEERASKAKEQLAATLAAAERAEREAKAARAAAERRNQTETSDADLVATFIDAEEAFRQEGGSMKEVLGGEGGVLPTAKAPLRKEGKGGTLARWGLGHSKSSMTDGLSWANQTRRNMRRFTRNWGGDPTKARRRHT